MSERSDTTVRINHTSTDNFENFGITFQKRNIFGLQSSRQLNERLAQTFGDSPCLDFL